MPLDCYIDKEAKKNALKEAEQSWTFRSNLEAAEKSVGKMKIRRAPYVLDIAAGQHKICKQSWPTITKGRGAGRSYYFPHLRRRATMFEICFQQGPIAVTEWFHCMKF